MVNETLRNGNEATRRLPRRLLRGDVYSHARTEEIARHRYTDGLFMINSVTTEPRRTRTVGNGPTAKRAAVHPGETERPLLLQVIPSAVLRSIQLMRSGVDMASRAFWM